MKVEFLLAFEFSSVRCFVQVGIELMAPNELKLIELLSEDPGWSEKRWEMKHPDFLLYYYFGPT